MELNIPEGASPEHRKLAQAQAPERIEKAHDIMENAKAIHGPMFATYLAFHTKLHQFKTFFEHMHGAIMSMPQCQTEEEAERLGKIFETNADACISVVVAMDDQVAHMCGMDDAKSQEACKTANQLADISTIKLRV